MQNDLDTMETIQAEKARNISKKQPQPLDKEGVMMAEHKRFTIDTIDTPADPLR